MASQEELKVSMEKEVHLMREMLANMHQEELSLLLRDKNGWTYTLQERSKLIELLARLRLSRIQTTKTRELPAQTFSALKEENRCEILLLRDQIMALVERINFQLVRNETLFKQVGNELGAPTPEKRRQDSLPAKAKIAIATETKKGLAL